GFGYLPTVFVDAARIDSTTQRVRTRHTGLQDRTWGSDFLKTGEFGDCSEAMTGAELADDLILSTLIVGRRSEAASRHGLWIKAFQTAIEGEIKVIASLFTVSDDV